jgi:hypothetical protein
MAYGSDYTLSAPGLGEADLRVRRSQIVIQRQRPLALSHALGRAVRVNLHGAQHQVGTGIVRREGQCLYQRRLGRREMSAPVVGKAAKSNSRIDTRQTDHRADTSGIDGLGTFSRNNAMVVCDKLVVIVFQMPLGQQGSPAVTAHRSAAKC